MDAEVRALKIEIAEAIRRKLEADRRPGDDQIVIQAVSHVMCDLISSCAQSEEHRQSLIRIMTMMLQACTKVRPDAKPHR